MRRIGIFIILAICLIIALAGCIGQPSSREKPPPIPTTIPMPTTTSSPTSTPIPSPTPTSTPAPTIILAPAPTSAPTTGELKVHFIDVGQGDSILLDLGETEILIDGGGKAPGVVAYLNDFVDGALEVMIATHPDADHIGGLIDVLTEFEVNEIWHNGDPKKTKTFSDFRLAINAEQAKVRVLTRGDVLEVDELIFNVLHPTSLNGTVNNNSIVLSLSYGKIEFLFMGDAEKEAESSILGTGAVPNAEILKVGHHGSSSSSSAPFLDAVKPEIAIYMAGEGNRYGHPHEETIQALLEVGAEIYGTDVHGTIVVTTDGEKYELQLEKQAPPATLLATSSSSSSQPQRLTPTPTPATTLTPDMELVSVYKILDSDRALIIRENSEVWILEKGIGCLSLDFYEGRYIYIYSPGLFAGAGSKIILPERDQQCRIWDAEFLGTEPPIVESHFNGTFEGWDGDTIFELRNGQIWQQVSYSYIYHYAYSPEVFIYSTNGEYKMIVDGVSVTIYVRQLK